MAESQSAMDPSEAIFRDLPKGLYLPIFGFVLAYHETGQTVLLLLAVIQTVSASYSDVWIMQLANELAQEMDSIEDVPTPVEMAERITILSWSIPVVVLSILGFVGSIVYFGFLGYSNFLLYGLAVAQGIILIRAFFQAYLGGFLTS